MDDCIRKEYLRVKDLISEEEFLEKCEKLHHRIGLSAKDDSKLWKPYDGHLYFHDKNDFPFKELYDDGFVEFPLTDFDISRILSESLIKDINLIDKNDYAVCYNRESYLGGAVEFIKKHEIYNENVINKFKEEQSFFILNYCKENNILENFDKNYHDFSSADDLINFLNDNSDKYPSLNWSLKYFNNHKNDFNNIKDVYAMIIEFEHMYRFNDFSVPLDISYEDQINFINEMMGYYMDFYKEKHDSYDFWDQFGVNSIIH